jgi:hypothetical protein
MVLGSARNRETLRSTPTKASYRSSAAADRCCDGSLRPHSRYCPILSSSNHSKVYSLGRVKCYVTNKEKRISESNVMKEKSCAFSATSDVVTLFLATRRRYNLVTSLLKTSWSTFLSGHEPSEKLLCAVLRT